MFGMFGAKRPKPFGITPSPELAGAVAAIPNRPEIAVLGSSAPMQVPQMTPDMLGPLPTLPQKQGFNWQHAAGILGDVLSGAAGGQANYTQGMMQQRAMEQRQQQAAMQAEAENRQWYEREQWKLNNKPPSEPYRWESNDGSLMEIGADGQPRVVYKDPTEKTNWVRADNGDGTFTMVPMGLNGPISAPQGQSPTAPVGKLKPLGGPTPQASGNFRR